MSLLINSNSSARSIFGILSGYFRPIFIGDAPPRDRHLSIHCRLPDRSICLSFRLRVTVSAGIANLSAVSPLIYTAIRYATTQQNESIGMPPRRLADLDDNQERGTGELIIDATMNRLRPLKTNCYHVRQSRIYSLASCRRRYFKVRGGAGRGNEGRRIEFGVRCGILDFSTRHRSHITTHLVVVFFSFRCCSCWATTSRIAQAPSFQIGSG